MRTGMTELRSAIAAALSCLHAEQFLPADYDALAERAQAQAGHVIENCKLPEATNEQLHLVLAQILEGTAALRGEGTCAAGAAAIIHAMDAYGSAFDRPGWIRWAAEHGTNRPVMKVSCPC
jgi:hypothetical protein